MCSIGECLSLRHRDWHVGQGSTPFLEVVPATGHPHRMRAKSGRFRRVYVSDDLERLYSEYVWRLVDAGAAEEVDDLDGHWVFVNLSRGQRFSALRPESVYAKVRAVKAHLGPAVPADWSPHWFQHTHSSALLLAGTPAHVVMRRLGHADIQTTLGLYGWVTEDAQLKLKLGRSPVGAPSALQKWAPMGRRGRLGLLGTSAPGRTLARTDRRDDRPGLLVKNDLVDHRPLDTEQLFP